MLFDDIFFTFFGNGFTGFCYLGRIPCFRSIYDHAEVTISDDDGTNTIAFNVWSPRRGMMHTVLPRLMREAKNSMFFYTDKSKGEIVSKWVDLFNEIEEDRFILNKNCAYASRQLIHEIIGLKLYSGLKCSWVTLFVWICQTDGLVINTGEDLWQRVKHTLKNNLDDYYDSTDSGGLKFEDFLKYS